VITGGSSGIGLSTALRLVARGDRVAICGRDPERLQTAIRRLAETCPTGEGETIVAVDCDLGRSGEAARFIDSVIRRWGRIDVLVNNAGVARLAPIQEVSDEDFHSMLHVNVRAVFESVRAAWTSLAASCGVIVNVSSMAAVDPFPGFSVYGACKAWVDLFSTALANEGKPCGISVFSVHPGAVETKMLRSLFPEYPAGQALDPDQVAAVIEQLTDATFLPCSGAILPIRPCQP
jgi:3-oxoacyl-[acyl-carrier protein] reductase